MKSVNDYFLQMCRDTSVYVLNIDAKIHCKALKCDDGENVSIVLFIFLAKLSRKQKYQDILNRFIKCVATC